MTCVRPPTLRSESVSSSGDEPFFLSSSQKSLTHPDLTVLVSDLPKVLEDQNGSFVHDIRFQNTSSFDCLIWFGDTIRLSSKVRHFLYFWTIPFPGVISVVREPIFETFRQSPNFKVNLTSLFQSDSSVFPVLDFLHSLVRHTDRLLVGCTFIFRVRPRTVTEVVGRFSSSTDLVPPTTLSSSLGTT